MPEIDDASIIDARALLLCMHIRLVTVNWSPNPSQSPSSPISVITMRAVQFLALLPLALASPLLPRQAANPPTNSTSASGPQVTFYPDSSSPVAATGVNYPQAQQDVFFGIPYAKPRKFRVLPMCVQVIMGSASAVGDLRFTAPQSPKWNTTQFEATKQPPACLQNQNELSAVDYYGTYGYSEDCLYLNVFAPENATTSQAKLPVMVWLCVSCRGSNQHIELIPGLGTAGRSCPVQPATTTPLL